MCANTWVSTPCAWPERVVTPAAPATGRFLLALTSMVALAAMAPASAAQAGAGEDRHCLRTLFTARDTRDTRRLQVSPYYQVSAAGHWEPQVHIDTEPGTEHAEFAFIPKKRPSRSHRARIQLNYYQFPDPTEYLEVDFDFSLTHLMEPAVQSDVAFQWLTLFEFWNEPGWTESRFPFRISFNLKKTAAQRHLQPLLHGQVKDPDSKQWTSVWETTLDFRVVAGERYRFRFAADVGQPGGLAIDLEGQGQYVSFVAPRAFLVHPDNPGDRSLWGFNPVKLYTSGRILDELDARGGRLAVTYYPATICTDAKGLVEDQSGVPGPNSAGVRSAGSAQ